MIVEKEQHLQFHIHINNKAGKTKFVKKENHSQFHIHINKKAEKTNFKVLTNQLNAYPNLESTF